MKQKPYIIIEDGYLRGEFDTYQEAVARVLQLRDRYREECELEERYEMPDLGMYQLHLAVI